MLWGLHWISLTPIWLADQFVASTQASPIGKITAIAIARCFSLARVAVGSLDAKLLERKILVFLLPRVSIWVKPLLDSPRDMRLNILGFSFDLALVLHSGSCVIKLYRFRVAALFVQEFQPNQSECTARPRVYISFQNPASEANAKTTQTTHKGSLFVNNQRFTCNAFCYKAHQLFWSKLHR